MADSADLDFTVEWQQVFVRNLAGHSLSVQADLGSDWSQFAQLFRRRHQRCRIRFFYGGRHLEPGVPLRRYGIAKEATIHVVFQAPQACLQCRRRHGRRVVSQEQARARGVDVRVTDVSGATLVEKKACSLMTPVRAVKAWLRDASAVPITEQCLLLGRKVLQDRERLFQQLNLLEENEPCLHMTWVRLAAPDLPPGEHWTQYLVDHSSELSWWHYDGPLGEWWFSRDMDFDSRPHHLPGGYASCVPQRTV
mmetsp:Transcript_71761/g.203623  ORF Transcript_71761/g.203623 Transcript_71761/m.203623 type:complete len:251 (+) Transcript_71761:73-825(+)